MTAPVIAPLLATAGFGWLYYRRVRRQFGRQPYRPVRTMLRIGLLAVLACGLVAMGALSHRLGQALLLGGLAGGALGWLSLRHAHVAVVDGVRGYTPNPWVGGAIALLLVARLAWRGFRIGAFEAGVSPGIVQASPLTYGLLVALVACYLVSGIGLALRMRALSPD